MDIDNLKVSRDLKIIFMGTPVFACGILEGLIDKYGVRAVVTQPDKIRGKDNSVSFSPIKQVAIDNVILVLQPTNIREDFSEIVDMKPDLIITCAYGQIVPKEILKCARLGCINVHASLLPKLRGGAPIHKAIIDGHIKTGITIMYMNDGMDTGDIITMREIEIFSDDTANSLHNRLAILGKELLMDTLPSVIEGTNKRIPQDDIEATYAYNIKREDEKIKFSKTAKQVYDQIRGMNSWPGAYCMFEDKILKVWSSYVSDNYPSGEFGCITGVYDDGFGVKVSNGEIVFTEIQLEGKRKMSAKDFINGNKDLVGKFLK